MIADTDEYGPRIEYARRSMDQAIDEWQADHAAVREDLWVWQDRLGRVNRLYDLILDLDDMIQRDITSDRIPYSDAVEKSLTTLISLWSSMESRYRPQLERLEAKYGKLEVGEEYRRRVQEAKNVLTDDADFFSGSKLAAMEAAAIEDYRAGRTEEYI